MSTLTEVQPIPGEKWKIDHAVYDFIGLAVGKNGVSYYVWQPTYDTCHESHGEKPLFLMPTADWDYCSRERVDSDQDKFFNKLLRGDTSEDDIEDAIHEWHSTHKGCLKYQSLHDFLGMTDDEYGKWVADAYSLPKLVAERNKN